MNRAFAATSPEIEKGPWNAWMWRVGISWLNLSRCDCQRKGRRSPSGVRRLCRWSQSRKCQSHWICLDVTVNEKVDGALRASVDFVVEVNPENANIEIRSPIQDYHGLCPIIRANRAPEGYILLIMYTVSSSADDNPYSIRYDLGDVAHFISYRSALAVPITIHIPCIVIRETYFISSTLWLQLQCPRYFIFYLPWYCILSLSFHLWVLFLFCRTIHPSVASCSGTLDLWIAGLGCIVLCVWCGCVRALYNWTFQLQIYTAHALWLTALCVRKKM